MLVKRLGYVWVGATLSRSHARPVIMVILEAGQELTAVWNADAFVGQ